MAQENNPFIGIIGLGYVGLPLASLLATKYRVVGFDINLKRVNDLKNGHDNTNEVEKEVLKNIITQDIHVQKGLFLTTSPNDLANCNFYIITVPTPVDHNKKPNLTPLFSASATVGNVLKKNDIVVYESTVYPGATEDDCVPILEKKSGLIFNQDFFVGYSPERINPGDKVYNIKNVVKVTSGSTPSTAEKVNQLYASVIEAGTHLAPSIRVAEAAKVIENAQRDINIAFVNELAKIFNLMQLDTEAVLEAAATKWNFLPFKPGLVGGHCIGVDPYYLAQKAQNLGYHPEIILTGRRLNDSMGDYVASQVIKLMTKKNILINQAKILVLGITFKENCPDVRNTKVVDIIYALQDFGTLVTILDPHANPEEVMSNYGLHSENNLNSESIINQTFDGIVLAVAHEAFLSINLKSLLKPTAVVYDVKSFLPFEVDGKL